MADLFVSYARQDRHRVEPLIELLEAQGWDVWWDREISPGATFRQEIEEELDRAHCVLAVWTANSITSNWVIAEASEGLSRRALIPVRFEDVRIPLEFRQTQSCELLGWPRDQDPQQVSALLAAVARTIERPVTRPPAPAPPRRGRWLPAAGGATLLIALLALTGWWTTRASNPEATALDAESLSAEARDSDRPPRDAPITLRIETIVGAPPALSLELERALSRIRSLRIISGDREGGGVVPPSRFVLRGVERNGRLTLSLYDVEQDQTRSTFGFDLSSVELANVARATTDRVARQFDDTVDLPGAPGDEGLYLDYLAIRQALRSSSGDDEAALLAELESLLDRAPRFAEAAAGLCDGYTTRYLNVTDPEFFENAERACARALRLDARNPWVQISFGNLYVQAGQLENAEAAFDEALAASPWLTPAIRGLARVAQARRDTERAEALLLQARDQEPENWSNHASLAQLYFREGRWAQAAEAYEDALQSSRGNARVLNDIGSAYFMLGRFADAVARWRQSTEQAPSAVGYSNLGSALYYEREFDAATDAYERAIDLGEDDYRMWLNAGEAAFHSSTRDSTPFYRRAQELATRAWQINPDATEVLSALALAHASAGDAEDARRYLNALERLEPLDVYALYDMAVAHRRLGSEETSRALVERLVQAGYPQMLIQRDANFDQEERE